MMNKYAHAAAIPFNECVMVALTHKTAILVTHQVTNSESSSQSIHVESIPTSPDGSETLKKQLERTYAPTNE